MPNCKVTILLLCVCLLVFFESFAQQDPLFSQYHFNQLVINPGYTGINNNTSIGVTSRLQWISGLNGGTVEGNPITNTLTGQTTFFNNKVGLGAIFVQDKLGISNNFEAHITYSYKLTWQDKTLSFGLQTGMVSINYDYDQLTLKSIDDPAFQGISISGTKPNFGAGVAYMSNNMFVGLSAPRMLNTEFGDGITSSLRYKRHYYGSFAYLLDINSILKLKPSVLIRMVEGAPVSYDLNGLLLINNSIWAGAFTRNFKTLGFIFQFDFSNAYRLGYNFELPLVTGLTQYTTHEFMFSIDLGLWGQQSVYQRYF